jgi:hypothetical protein
MQLKLICKEENDPNNLVYLKSTEFFLQELLGEKTYSHVEKVFIKVQASMGDLGECFVRVLKNGNITIRMKFKKKLNFIESIITLAHECVHAKQFITGQLYIDDNDVWWWKGKSYGDDPYEGLTPSEYYTVLPWEREAARKENDLVIKYLNYYFSNPLPV